MLTEQEAIAQLNEKIANGTVKPETKKYLDKLAALQSRLEKQISELDKIREQEKQADIEIQRLKGAISILLELCADSEGMLPA